MPNHYHLLVYLKTDRFSKLMQAFTLSYAKAINKRYQRVGSLFQGRFEAINVDREEYLLHLTRYIHLNPPGGFNRVYKNKVCLRRLRDKNCSLGSFCEYLLVSQTKPYIEQYHNLDRQSSAGNGKCTIG